VAAIRAVGVGGDPCGAMQRIQRTLADSSSNFNPHNTFEI